MRRLLILLVFIILKTSIWGQKNEFNDLDEALKQPLKVRSLSLENQTKYSDFEVLPDKLTSCINLQKIFIGWHQSLDLPKLFQLLAKLPKLDTLTMYACEMSAIPKEIGLLKNLKYISFELNNITSISSEIKNLKSLKYLNLGKNALTFLPNEIGDLENLNQLILDENALTKLPSSICNLKNLSELNLKYNNLKSLPEDIHNLINLKVLDISNNELTFLPENTGELTIDELYFGGDNDRFEIFPNQIFNIETLRHLEVYNINVDSISLGILKLNNLTSISLRSLRKFNWSYGFLVLSKLNSLKKADFEFFQNDSIPKEISLLTNLIELKLSGSNNSYQAMQYVSKIKSLKTLEFKNYNSEILPIEFFELNTLEELYLTSKNLMRLIIPKEIEKLKNLRKLDIGNSEIKELPEEFGNLLNLEELLLWGVSLKSLPTSFGQLHKLSLLYLSGNQLTELPSVFYQLKSLRNLNLSQNRIQEIDDDFCNLVNLEYLNLSYNRGLKSIPECFGELKCLKEIDVSGIKKISLPKTLKRKKGLKISIGTD